LQWQSEALTTWLDLALRTFQLMTDLSGSGSYLVIFEAFGKNFFQSLINYLVPVSSRPINFGSGGSGTGTQIQHNIPCLFNKYSLTSGFWPRVRARSLRAPVFLGSLPCPSGRFAPPPAHRSFAAPPQIKE
jgi:hypothetical protein